MVHIITQLPLPAKNQVLSFIKKESNSMHEVLTVQDGKGNKVKVEVCRYYSEPDIILHYGGHECRLNENLNIVKSDIGLQG